MGMATKYCRCFQSGNKSASLLCLLLNIRPKIAWLSIGLASWRFRRAWVLQGREMSELKFQGARWTWGWGSPFVVCSSVYTKARLQQNF